MKKYFYLIKRFFKHPGIYIIFGLVFASLFCLKNFSLDYGQIATIGVVLENDYDSTSKDFYDHLLEQKNNFSFIEFSNYEQAQQQLLIGNLDEIWFIPKNLGSTLQNFVQNKNVKNPIEITILQNEVSHMFLREVLFSNLMKYVSEALCKQYLISNIQKSKSIKNFSSIFKLNTPEDKLFEMGFLNGAIESSEPASIFLLPLRGMFAVWLLICCFAISLSFINDWNNELFVWWKFKSKNTISFFYHFWLMIIPSIFVFITFIFAGVFTNFITELIYLLLYIISCIVFVNILRALCGSCKNLGIFMTITIFMVIIFSPVFIEINIKIPISYLFPTFYYLKGINNPKYEYFQIIYIFIGAFIWFCANKIITNNYRHILR